MTPQVGQLEPWELLRAHREGPAPFGSRFGHGCRALALPFQFLPAGSRSWFAMAERFPFAGQIEKTVAGLESLKKLLIIWLMCLRLRAWEINHQQWHELLKWIWRVLSSVSPEGPHGPSPSGEQVQTCCRFTFPAPGTAGGRAGSSVLLH